MEFNGTSFSLQSFTSVLAGGGALVGIAAIVVTALAVVYALCFRRGRVSFTRAGLTIEPSPPRAESEPSRDTLPPLRLDAPSTAPIPRRERRKSTRTEAPGDAPSEAAEDTASTRL
jgi:hypothetical protein